MPKVGQTTGQRLRQERRDALREQLSAQGHVQHVVDMLDKVRDLENPLDQNQVSRLKIAIDTKLKIIAKYLPDDKEPQDLNIGGQEDNPLTVQEVTRSIVDPKHSDS